MIEHIVFADSNKGACYKYRVATPAKYISQVGDVHSWYSSKWEASYKDKVHLVTFQRNSTKEALHLLWQLHLKKFPIIFDIDDDIFHIPLDNPVHNLTLSNPGVLVHQIYGVRFANVVTVTCPQLKRLYEVINPNVRILPNCIDMDDWKGITPVLRKFRKTCTLFWGGSPTHNGDLEMIKPVLKQLHEKFDIEIVFMGTDPKDDEFPVTYIPFGTYKFFQRVMYSCDIGLAPMRDSPFNRGKSNLRLKELGMAKLPIVASQVGEYDNDKSGALLCKTESDWYSALASLIEDKEKRKLSAKATRAWAGTWDIKKHIHLWNEVYEEMLDEYERGSLSQTVRIQGPQRSTRLSRSGTVRVGGNPLDRNGNT